jgi:hypothetical protein
MRLVSFLRRTRMESPGFYFGITKMVSNLCFPFFSFLSLFQVAMNPPHHVALVVDCWCCSSSLLGPNVALLCLSRDDSSCNRGALPELPRSCSLLYLILRQTYINYSYFGYGVKIIVLVQR